MSLTFTTNQVGANPDYARYASGPIKKTDKVNAPDLLDFSLVNYDGNMVKLQRGTHFVLVTSTYGLWFSGYITNDPEPVYLGTNKGLPVWQYNYEATGEEYLLNLKPFGIMAPFTNTTQGAIIKALIAHLSPPGVTFDVSGVQDGQQVPRFIVDPNQHFSEIVDAFAKSAHFVFRCHDFAASYVQQDSTLPPIAVDGNSEHFTPSGLQIKAAGDPIINDSIVLGAIEPQNYMEEFFMGDGATATFPLISSVFGVDSTLLLDDDFSSNAIDTTKWTVYDTSAGYLQPYGGTLNVLGGSNTNTLDVSLQSASLIPLEGNLRCTHGEWDFISQSDGVLGGLWTGQTNGSMTGLVYGIRALASGGSGTVLHPIAGSSVDTTQSVPIDYNKRYVMRTIYSFGETKRATPTSSYRDQSGVIHSIGLTTNPDHFYATTVITELDPITAVMTHQWTWTTDLGTESALYAYYVPVASNNLNLTVCSVTVSVPMQATLQVKPSSTTNTVVVDGRCKPWVSVGTLNTAYPVSGMSTGLNPAVLPVTPGTVVRITYQSGLASFYNPVGSTLGATSGNAYGSWDANGAEGANGNATPYAGQYVSTPVNQQSLLGAWADTTGQLVAAPFAVGNDSGLLTVPSGAARLLLGMNDGSTWDDNSGSWTVRVVVSNISTWNTELMGPNEIDSLDGLAPAATIVDSNNGAQTRSSLLGSANYNPGQATLTFFKNTAQLISYLPNQGDLVHLSYRQAGASIGRAQSKTSIASEASGWGDDGVRSETKRDLTPLPMTSAECELAAVARVNDNCYQHWSGTYTLPSGPWFTGQPTAGVILPFQNLPAQFPSVLQAEEVTQVESTLVSENPTEVFNHVITFGPVSSIENVLAAVKNTNDVFTPQDTAEIPQFIDVSSLGLTTMPSVPRFVYTGQDANYWHFKFIDTLPNPSPSGLGIEIRYTDNGWGPDNGNNLIGRITTGHTGSGSVVVGSSGGLPTFSIPRTVRGKVAFMRCYDERNVILYSEDLTQSAWTKGSGTTVTQTRMKDPDGDFSMISAVSFPSSGGTISQTTGVQAEWPSAEFSVSLLGTTGKQYNLTVSEAGSFPATTVVTCNGRWQRVTVPYPVSPLSHSDFLVAITPVATGISTLYVTRASMEIGVLTESTYCKTNGVVYGASSRFSTGVHTALPMIPPSPTARGDFSKISAPVVSVVLPANLSDVWGCEIRAEDNLTVLFKTDLNNATLSPPTITGDTSMVLSTKAPALSKRAFSYWVYTYNLFGEYSAGFNYAGTLSDPSVTNLSVFNNEKMVVWTGNNATAYEVYVDTVDDTLTNLSVEAATINTFYPLSDPDFFGLRYIAVTPYDELGPGVTMGGWFEYTPGMGGWPPAATITNPSFESGATSWSLGTNFGVGQGHACFGSESAYVAGTQTSPLTTAGSIINSTDVAVTPGSTYYAQAMIDASSATDLYSLQYAGSQPIGSCVTLTFYNSSAVPLAAHSGNLIIAGGVGWNLSYVAAVAPAGAAYAWVGCTVNNQTSGTIFMDDFDLNIVPATPTSVPSGAVYVKLANVGPDHNIHISTSLNPQGSVLPNQPIPLSYTVTSNTIDVSVAAISLLRADGTTLSVASATQSYTGLTQTTTYYFYPFVDATTGALGFTNPSPPSTSPSAAQAMQANFDGCIPLVPFSVTTLATGGGTSGGGGGGIQCPEANELVDIDGKGQVKAGDVVAGDMIKGWSFRESKEVYRRVIQAYSVTCASWYMVNGYRCSPTEPVYVSDQWTIAFRVPGATLDTTKSSKVNISVETDEYDEQNYYLVTGETPLLIHNIPINC
jgi:hypothetical protein